MKNNIKKFTVVLFIILITIFPLVFMFIMNGRNSIYKETEAYMQYLYFNWIDYPKKAERFEALPSDINEEIFSWFSYDRDGNPLINGYYDIDFKYNGKFISEKDYIAVPFENGGQTYYRKLILNAGKITGISDSVWK